MAETADATPMEEVDASDRVSVMMKEFGEEYSTDEGKKGLQSDVINETAREAQDAYRDGNFEKALEKFGRYLVAIRRGHSDGYELESEASLLSNLGACLHHLDEFELAQKYYTKALDLFENKCYTGRVAWLFYGDINQKRIDFIKARLDTLSKQQKPDASKYLNSSGNEASWENKDGEEAVDDSGTLAYVNPFAWYRWYYSAPAAAAPGEGEAPAAAPSSSAEV